MENVIRYHRDLHQSPEVGFGEVKMAAVCIQKQLYTRLGHDAHTAMLLELADHLVERAFC